MSDPVIIVELAKPVAEQTVQQRMVACGNSIGLKLLRQRGDDTITDEMIELAEVTRKALITRGPGYKEGRRGW